MPWLEERTLILFVRDTEIRRYEPGVSECWIDVDSQTNTDTDTNTNPDAHTGCLSLERRGHCVVHGHGLVRQHAEGEQDLHVRKKVLHKSHPLGTSIENRTLTAVRVGGG